MNKNHSLNIYSRILLILALLVSSSFFSVMSFAKDSKVKQKTNLDFTVIPMHYGLLKGEPWTWSETEGLTPFLISSDAFAGDSQITLSAQDLHESELFVYQTNVGNYFVGQVKSIEGNIYHLTNQLHGDISSGSAIWNFYDNGSHPNKVGYKAIADFAINQLNTAKIKNKKHVFVGDSWFNDGALIERLASKVVMSDIINKAIHGRTSADTLEAFDTDLSEVDSPNFIWVSLGTNDYWQKPPVNTEDFINNLENIIIKINALGAKAIVIDSSVGIYDNGGPEPKGLSDRYANALHKLQKNNNLGEKSSAAGSFFILDFLSLFGLWVYAKKVSMTPS